jgi:hypothetical protein
MTSMRSGGGQEYHSRAVLPQRPGTASRAPTGPQHNNAAFAGALAW